MKTDNMTARIAGFLYLIMGILSAFSMMYVDPKLYVAGNAAATMNNILSNQFLFRMGFVSNLAGQIIFLFLGYALYQLFKSAGKELSRIMIILVVASVPITCLDMLNQFAPVLLLSGAGNSGAFNTSQLQALAMAFLDIQRFGLFIAQIFWGLWLFPLGLLILRSNLVPKILGIFLLLTGSGYLFDSIGKFLIQNYNLTISMFTFFGELLLIFWLLIKGVKEQKTIV